MAGRPIGYVALPVIPSLNSFGRDLTAGISKPIAVASTEAGRSAGAGIASGIASGAKTAVAAAGKVLTVGFGIVAAGGAAIAAKAFGGGFSRALNIQDAQKQLEGLGHSTETITTIMGNALASVKGTAFGLDAAATQAATLVAAGIAPGLALERTLKLTADAATIAKVPLGEMGQIIGKVASGQKLTTEVVQQFAQRGVPLLQMVANQYGVTAAEAQEMVTNGEVSFEAFQAALESGVGGAALKSGETARGAFANIGAALSRFGAMFATPLVAAAPSFFGSISGAVDRASTAAAPFAEIMAGKVVSAMTAVAGWIDRVDFGAIAGGMREFYLGAVDVKDLLATGFTENETLLPPSVVSGLQVAHDVLAGVASGVRGMIAAFQGGGGLSGVGVQFESIKASVTTLQPAVQTFITALPNIGGAVATLAAAGLNVLVQVLSFLADNVDTIIAFMPAIVAGFLLWKGATAVVFAQSQALATLQLRMLPLTTANTFARLAAARAELQLAAATGTSVAAQNGGLFASTRATAAMVGQKVAMIAGSAATGIATAAQWAWNAALTANPIGIIIVAIAALVAGLVWFFTQTELGQQVWANVTSFIGTVVTWLWETVISPIFQAIGAIFTWVYENIIMPVVTGIMIYIGLWAAIITWLWETILAPAFQGIGMIVTWIWESVIMPVVNFIVGYFQFLGSIALWLWNNVLVPAFQGIGTIVQWVWTSVISPVVNFIVGYFQFLGSIAMWLWQSIIMPAINGIGAVFNWLWNSIISPVGAFIGNAFTQIGNTANAVFSGMAGFIGSAFQAIIGVVRAPVNAVIGIINSAIGAINGISVTIPSWVPIVGGQTFAANIPKIPTLATGADVMARRGGTLAILGEGGQDETVTNLGETNRQMAATRKLAEAVASGGAGDGRGTPTVRVYIGDRELTALVTDVVVEYDDDQGDRTARGKRPKF